MIDGVEEAADKEESNKESIMAGMKRYLEPSDRREVMGNDSFALENTLNLNKIFIEYYKMQKIG